MQDKIERLKEIENIVQKKTEEVLSIQSKNYPLDSRRFLPKEDYTKVITIDQEIAKLSEEYLAIYNSLDLDEKSKYNYKNLKKTYYQHTHQEKGLEIADVRDEHSINRAFNKAYNLGKEAIDNLVNFGKNNSNIDQEQINKNRRVLNKCQNVLNAHFWGKAYIDKLMRYEKRVVSGRAIHEDITDYRNLVIKTKELARQYAQAIQRGASEEELKKFYGTFEEAFKKETELLEFVPDEMLGSDRVNLHWLKVDAERNPQNLYNENNSFKRI